MKLIRFIQVSFLISAVVLSTSGINVFEHFCSSCKIDEIHYFLDKFEHHDTKNSCCKTENTLNSCCGNKQNCTFDKFENTDCCQTNSAFIKIDDFVTFSKSFKASIHFNFNILNLNKFISKIKQQFELNSDFYFTEYFAPPDAEIHFCVLRI